MMKVILKYILGVTLFTYFLNVPIGFGQPVSVCDDSGEWPPYSYYPRNNGVPDKTQLTGAMMDLMKEAFKVAGLEYKVGIIPWKRCLRELADYKKTKKYEVAIEGTLNEKRLATMYATARVYTTSGAMWYSKKKFKNGPPDVKSTDDLPKYKLCGIHGYNYVKYGVKNEQVARDPKTFGAAFKMVSLGRCDIFLSNIPGPRGRVATGELTIPEDVTVSKIPGIKQGTFHVFVAKDSPRAMEIVTKLNQAILLLGLNGEHDKIFNKYIPECGRKC